MINRPVLRPAALLLAALISLPGVSMAGDSDANAELGLILKDLSQEIRALRGEVKELREEMKQARERPAAAAPARAQRDPNRRYEIALNASDRVKGDDAAKYALVEFSDFQCPFCNRFHTQAMPQLQKAYIDSGKLRYVFKDFPLAFHKQAPGAHVAAECAGRQSDDAYWAMHHGLFSNQKRLGPELYEQLARAQSLDLERFRDCLDDPEVTAAMERDIEEGRGHGVRGTPTFFVGVLKDGEVVNARRISGAQPFENFATVIDAVLGAQ